ncbi:MAG: 2-polyprenyl-3-methyl-5-hydroxy-6-metoxy-1,4-benzoquinol methylase, partial [Marinoscillum sp.]
MYERLDVCPSCKHTHFLNHIICKDHAASGESFAIVKCTKCDLLFTNPRPNQSNISKYYEHADYISHTNNANNPINLLYKLARRYTLSQKISLITKFTPNKYLLDYGCGTGIFTNYAKSRGYIVDAVEPSPDARRIADDILGITVKSNVVKIKPKSYDIITAWHVIEHVHELRITLNTLRKSLRDNGIIFIAVPNCLSYEAIKYQENWAAYDVPRHLYHFTQSSFKTLAHNCKLHLVETVPMKLDAFYVSMLSEKYLNRGNS